jgi:hypothetical protein
MAMWSDEYSVASTWCDDSLDAPHAYSVASTWCDDSVAPCPPLPLRRMENDPWMVAPPSGHDYDVRHENDGGHANRGGHENDPLSRADPWSQLGQGRSSDQAISDMKRDESKWWQEKGHPKNIIKMYMELCGDRQILEEAFEVFVREESYLAWHWKWHEHADLDRCGCGQYYAMVVMKSAMPNAVRGHGISNQDRVHKYMEAFMAYVMKGQSRLQWQWAVSNMIDFMQALYKLASAALPDGVPHGVIRDEWDIKRMQEIVNSRLHGDHDERAAFVWPYGEVYRN